MDLYSEGSDVIEIYSHPYSPKDTYYNSFAAVYNAIKLNHGCYKLMDSLVVNLIVDTNGIGELHMILS